MPTYCVRVAEVVEYEVQGEDEDDALKKFKALYALFEDDDKEANQALNKMRYDSDTEIEVLDEI